MKKIKNISLPVYLMSGSLLLLLVFIFLWLNRVYKDEYEALQRETDFLFVNSIRDVEDALFRKSGNKPVVLNLKDTVGLSSIESTGKAITLIDSIIVSNFKGGEIPVIPDTVNRFRNKHMTFTMVKQLDTQHEMRADSTLSITVKTMKGIGADPREFNGTLSFYMELDADSIQSDSAKQMATLKMLNEQFWKSRENNETILPENYNIILFTDSTGRSTRFRTLTSKQYKDIFSGDSFAVELPDYRMFLFKKMIPEMLFSLLLLGSIGLAFLMTYRSLTQQQKLTALKNDLISNITHELKTPITTVGVAIEALSNFDAKNDPERTREYLDISKLELNRLSILVDKVLKMSLFEQKQPVLHLEEVDLYSLVESVLGSMKLQFEKYSASVSFQARGTSFKVRGDRVHLTNVVYNLVENALKYTLDDPQIDIELFAAKEEVILKVSDNGIGIPEAYLGKIFDKFFRVPTGEKHNVKGHGLGLSYVAGVILQHGGRINAKNRKEGGICFELNLPGAG